MKCPSCGNEGGSGKFCRGCGSPMPAVSTMNCAACGAEVPTGAKFCLKCGAAQSSVTAAPVDENCAKCGRPLIPGAKFCRACGTPREAAAAHVAPTVVASVPVPTPPTPKTPPPEPERVINVAPSSPVVERVRPIAPAPVKAAPPAVPDEVPPAGSNKGPLIAILLMVAIVAGGMIWWFVVRNSTPAKAPIEKGPLYSVPAGQ